MSALGWHWCVSDGRCAVCRSGTVESKLRVVNKSRRWRSREACDHNNTACYRPRPCSGSLCSAYVAVYYCPRKRRQYCFQHIHEPSHLASWILAWTCPSTTSVSLLNIKVKVTWLSVRFCLHETRGQYLALIRGFTCFCFTYSRHFNVCEQIVALLQSVNLFGQLYDDDVELELYQQLTLM